MDKSIWEDPGKHGYVECPHCNGYGSSLKEDAKQCTFCGGEGLVKKEKADTYVPIRSN
jgi:DnaJ-class molecular chaperone